MRHFRPVANQFYTSADRMHRYVILDVVDAPWGRPGASGFRVRIATTADLAVGRQATWLDDAMFWMLVDDEGLQPASGEQTGSQPPGG